jgi:hypothetical protein
MAAPIMPMFRPTWYANNGTSRCSAIRHHFPLLSDAVVEDFVAVAHGSSWHEATIFECPLFGRDERQSGNLVQPHAPGAASALHAKNDVHDALHFIEPLRIQVVGHLDVFVVRPGDLEGEACGCELDEPQAEVASVGIMIVGLDVADAAVIVLKLTLNDKIGLIGPRQIKVIVAGGVIERDLEVLVAGISDRYVIGVESHGWGLASVRIIRSYLASDCQKARVKATGSECIG